VSRLLKTALTACLVLVMGACVPFCGIGAKFSLSNAHVDSEYKCPYPSNQAPYQVHGSIDADNSTTSAVTIKSMSEADELVNTAGQWNGPKTAKAGGPITSFSPKSIASGASSTIKFSVGFDCTNSGPTVTTYGEFTFKFTVVTSAGTYKIDAGNRHRLSFVSA
jgi:hypothetical protein